MSDTVIVLQDEGILAAEGRKGRMPQIDRMTYLPMQGYGEPLEQWKKLLAEYNEHFHPQKVKILLPASYSSTRMNHIPFAKGRQFEKIVENTLSEVSDEHVADYSIVSSDKKKGICLCCVGAENKVMAQLQKITDEIGMSVDKVSVPMEGYLKLLAMNKMSQNKTAIFLLFEDTSVVSILFKNGVYHYSTRSRLFSERGTLDFGTEIVRNISGILQFYATENSDQPITDVYYAGCMADDFSVSVEGIRNMNLSVAPLRLNVPIRGQGNIDNWVACVGAFIEDKKEKVVDLYHVWRQFQKGEAKSEKSIARHFIIPGITLGVCVLAGAAVFSANLIESLKIGTIYSWINNEQVQSEYSYANELQVQSQQLLQAQNQVTHMKNNLATYPDLTQDMIDEIVDVSGATMKVSIKTMDAESGLLEFDADSEAVIDIPGYIRKLSETGLFSSVDYTGYQYDESKSVYTLMLSCVLKAPENGDDAQ